MRKVKCVRECSGGLIKDGNVYEVVGDSKYQEGMIDIIIDYSVSGPWYKDRFIEVSFNKYLNLLK